MYQVFDRLQGNRITYYGKLKNAEAQMIILLLKFRMASDSTGFLDFGLRDREGTFWLPITRPGMPDERPDFPRRDLALIEYLQQWAVGVKYHAMADIAEMERRYPELTLIRGSYKIEATILFGNKRSGNWLYRAYKSIFK
jgi:hypothetical protein